MFLQLPDGSVIHAFSCVSAKRNPPGEDTERGPAPDVDSKIDVFSYGVLITCVYLPTVKHREVLNKIMSVSCEVQRFHVDRKTQATQDMKPMGVRWSIEDGNHVVVAVKR